MTCDVQCYTHHNLTGHGDVNSRYVPTRVAALAGAAAAAAPPPPPPPPPPASAPAASAVIYSCIQGLSSPVLLEERTILQQVV